MTRRRFDIRKYKNDLRTRFKAVRAGIKHRRKAEIDRMILGHLVVSPEYLQCESFLCYVSMPQEIDTRGLIEKALSDGKKVAVPRCINGTRRMEFYTIDSLEELSPGTYGVLEPEAIPEKKLERFEDSLCIVPGLAFDKYGYRLGYGGGYYDRFFSNGYDGHTAGICYSSCFMPYLKHGRYDIPCEFIVTENGRIKALSIK